MLDHPLAKYEHDETRAGTCEAQPRREGRPTPRASLDEPQTYETDATGNEDGAGEIEPAVRRRVATVGHEPDGKQKAGGCKRGQQPKDPAPSWTTGEATSNERPEGGTEVGETKRQSKRPSPDGVGECIGNSRDAHRENEGGPTP
jgi:hypothetical protein